MYLKSLVLKGFKSFADRSVMSFEPGITAIVGPNGSGKSNISDAVLWVLGERSPRNLRGQAMEDVIFSGSSARKPVGMAEVDLVLDNSDGTLPVEFNEVSISRRMYRNGENEYLINGTQARRMDVLDILHDSGIGTGTHSIIAQGHLSSILQSKPEDRRALVEEAAGVLKHKQRKEKSERKLALMDGHLTRVQDIVSEVQRQMKPLERKAKRAIAYQDASAELAEAQLELAVDDLRLLQASWDGLLEAERGAEAQAAAAHGAIDECEREAAKLQEQLQASTSVASASSARYRRAQAVLDKLDSNMLLLHEKKRSATSYLAEMQISLENDSRTAEAARAQRATAAETLERAQGESEAARSAQLEAQRRCDEARARQRALQAEIDQLSHKRREALSQLEDARSRLARAQEVLAGNRAKEQMIDTHAADLAQRLEAAQQAAQQASELASRTADELTQARKAEAEARHAAGSALNERDAARAAHDRAREARAAQAAQVRSLEELRRARQQSNPMLGWVVQHAQDLHVQVRPLIDSLKVPENLECVVEQLLGEDVESLFVEDEQAAVAIASRLASLQEPGSVSLLPCKGPGNASGEPRHGGNGPSRLVDHLECEAQMRPMVESLLGDVFLFDDVQQASSFAQAHPGSCCATETGFAVWSNGKVRCRRRRDAETGELADHRALEQAREKLEQAKQAESRALEQSRAGEAALQRAQAKGLDLSQKAAQLQGSAQAAQRERDRANAALESLQRESSQLEESRRRTADALGKAEPDAAAFAAQVQQLGDDIERYKEELDAKRGEMAPLRALAEQAASQLSEAKLQSATCAERSAYAKRMLEACERDIRNADAQAARARAGMDRKRAALSRIDPLLQVFSDLSAQAKLRADVLERQVCEQQGAADSLHGRINEARARTRGAHEAYDAASQKLADVRVQKSRVEMQVEAAVSSIVDDCGTPMETAARMPKLENRAEVEQRAEKLRRRIANMGTINPDAASDYEALKERYDYLASQLEDMQAARRSLRRIVAAIDARMKDDFANTFDVVNANFKQIFAELFPGGSGSLSLVDPDDLENTGVEVSAQPPGKRILKMSLMSGGEKSLTALALLFAVYKTRATPFYILDEVEAALDDTNLRRLVAYLNKLRDDSQFIIITHQRRTMEMADVLYGVSMHSDGVTKVMSQRLDRALEYAEG